MLQKIIPAWIVCTLLAFIPLESKCGTSILEKDKLDHRINDEAGILSSEENTALEQKLAHYEDTTSTQIVIVITKTVNDELSNLAPRLAEKWGIGQKKKNNGLLILIAIEDRDMFIATGYGLEGKLPDILCKRVIENEFKSHFKEEEYYAGIDAGVSKIISLLAGEYKAEYTQAIREDQIESFILSLFLVCVIGAFVCAINIPLGGTVGGLLSLGVGWFIMAFSLWYLVGTFVVGFIASILIHMSISASGDSGGYYIGGGYSSGSGGGFFSGFSSGGGSFGGGGAGGSW